MEKESITKVCQMALKKKELLHVNPLQYIIRAALSGIYIGFAIVLCFRIGQFFYEVHSPATSLLNGIFFGLALILIIYGGAELFTGNTMYFTIASLKKETTWKDALMNWVTCYAGNLLGVVFFSVLISLTGLFDSISYDHLLLNIVSIKMSLPASELFFRAILCNWLVCLAIWIPMQAKGDAAKVMIIMLLVFTFFISGYEHSIANLSLFTLALAIPHADTINVAGVIHNIIPVTAGNIIGGGFFVGALYAYLTSKQRSLNVESPIVVRHINSNKNKI
ncbi:formate/nitrite transporter family protein [Bacillus taeanensis]|uniref:Transporter n=1 Tax=Bacillus taeanensis TaxID=273032 RepID=A0A366Y3F3_9BACI|nr:formate/nitrite transporter family protein [Bacillus taeanensis]RBW70721.1 transporter [Bacillus taeanensis]